MNRADAQNAPGNGPGDGQSAAGSPPAGSQTSVREHAAQAGSTPTAGWGTGAVQDYRG